MDYNIPPLTKRMAVVEEQIKQLQRDVARALDILELQELREIAKKEVEAEMVAARAREEERIKERIQSGIDLADATGRFRGVIDARIDGTHKTRIAYITVGVSLLSILLGALGTSFFSNVKGK